MKKIILNLGYIASFVFPITSIIACGGVKDYSDYESKVQKLLDSTEANENLEILWQKKVLKQLYPQINFQFIENTPDVLKALKWIIESNVKNNPTYLIELQALIAKKLKNNNSFQHNNKKVIEKTFVLNLINAWGFNKTYQIKSWLDTYENIQFEANVLKPMATLLIGDNLKGRTNFQYLKLKSEIFKTLIVQKYLESTKEEWLQVFKSDENEKDREKSLTNVENAIDSKKYWILSKKLINNHYGFYWELVLNKVKSLKFVRESGLTFADANKQLQLFDLDKNSVSSNVGFSTKKTTSVNKILTAGREGLKNYIGFQGIKSVPSSTGKLDFSLSALKKINKFFVDTNAYNANKSNWDGFIQKKELIAPDSSSTKKDKILFIQKQKDKVKLTKVNLIMPIYNQGILTFNFNSRGISGNNKTINSSSKEYGYDAALLSFEIFKKDSGLYNDAIKFYTSKIKLVKNKSKGRNAIFLKIKNDYAKKVWQDQGIKFIN